jgi:polyhydroxybutyrate depolymerase
MRGRCENGCDTAPARNDTTTQIHYRYECPSGHDVELIALKDNGHAWPGGERGSRRGDEPSESLSATDVIWNFFLRHRLWR